jgi:hypothetical protein
MPQNKNYLQDPEGPVERKESHHTGDLQTSTVNTKL